MTDFSSQWYVGWKRKLKQIYAGESFCFALIALFKQHSWANVTLSLTLGNRPWQPPVWGTSLLTMMAIYLNWFLCVHTWIAVTLYGCPLTSTSPCAFRRLDYFCPLAKEKTEAQKSGIPCQRSSFEPSSDGPRTVTLWATDVSRQRNPSMCCPQAVCSALTLEKMKSCPFWKGMLRRWKHTMEEGNRPSASFNMVATSHSWSFEPKLKLVKIK